MHFLRILLLLAATVTPAIAASDAKSFGAWRVTCDGQTTDGMALCAASQTVATDPEGRKVVLGVIVERIVDGQIRPRITFRMSSKAFVAAGVGIKIDEDPPARLPIGACDNAICEARGWLNEAMTEQLPKGRLLRFAYFVDAKNQITFPVSLDGLAEALDYMAANHSSRR
jgi:invasion protein IalB